jgi:predicted transposase/invertase (TIGR01784 family)
LPDDTIFIIFAELRRFKKQLHECENDLENQPQELQDEIFTRLFDACDIPRFDEEKRIQYDKDMFDERRYNGEIAAAREEGHMEGHMEGRIEGRIEGLSKGRAVMCRAMLEKGIPKETVAEIADLTVAELDEMLCQY